MEQTEATTDKITTQFSDKISDLWKNCGVVPYEYDINPVALQSAASIYPYRLSNFKCLTHGLDDLEYLNVNYAPTTGFYNPEQYKWVLNGEPPKTASDWEVAAERVCVALEDVLKQPDDAKCDRERAKQALDLLYKGKDKENVIAAMKLLSRKDDLGALLNEVKAIVLQNGSGVQVCNEKLDEALKRNATDDKPRRNRKPRTASKKKGLMGRKTAYMAKQLRVFGMYLKDHKFGGDMSKLYGLAYNCWIANKAKWDKAKAATGGKRGYSCSKVLADAYRNAQ